MNKIICCFITCLFLSVNVFAQKNKSTVAQPDMPVNAETKLISYADKIEVANASKNALYAKAIEWANSFYKNPADVLRVKDAEKGNIVIKARFKIYNEADKKGVATAAGDVMYVMNIQFKDGMYRYEISSMNWQQTSAFPIERWMDTSASSYNSVAYPHYLKQTRDIVSEVATDFTSRMAASEKKKSDDW